MEAAAHHTVSSSAAHSGSSPGLATATEEERARRQSTISISSTESLSPRSREGFTEAPPEAAGSAVEAAEWMLMAPAEIRPLLVRGQRLVARDFVGEWIEARVIRVHPDRAAITVGFKGWGKWHNEIIGIADGRLRPLPTLGVAPEPGPADTDLSGKKKELQRLAFLNPGYRSVCAEQVKREKWRCPECHVASQGIECTKCGAQRPRSTKRNVRIVADNEWKCSVCRRSNLGVICTHCGKVRPSSSHDSSPAKRAAVYRDGRKTSERAAANVAASPVAAVTMAAKTDDSVAMDTSAADAAPEALPAASAAAAASTPPLAAEAPALPQPPDETPGTNGAKDTTSTIDANNASGASGANSDTVQRPSSPLAGAASPQTNEQAEASGQKIIPGVTFRLEPVYPTEDGKYKCQWCNQICTTRKTMRRHQTRSKFCVNLQIKAGRHAYPCEICDRIFWKIEALEYHIQCSHTNAPHASASPSGSAAASESAASAAAAPLLSQRVPGGGRMGQKDVVRPLYAAPLQSRGERVAQLKKEMQRLRPEKPALAIRIKYQCAVCGWHFQSREDLQGHLETLEHEKNVDALCRGKTLEGDADSTSSATDDELEGPTFTKMTGGKMGPASMEHDASSAADADFGRAVMIGSRATAAWTTHVGAGEGSRAEAAASASRQVKAASDIRQPLPQAGTSDDARDGAITSRATNALATHLAAVLSRVAATVPDEALPSVAVKEDEGSGGETNDRVSVEHRLPPAASEIHRLVTYPHMALLQAAAAHQAERLADKTSTAYATEAILIDADAALAHWRLQLQQAATSLRYLLTADAPTAQPSVPAE